MRSKSFSFREILIDFGVFNFLSFLIYFFPNFSGGGIGSCRRLRRVGSRKDYDWKEKDLAV